MKKSAFLKQSLRSAPKDNRLYHIHSNEHLVRQKLDQMIAGYASDDSYDNSSTIYCTQFMKKDWHQRLGGGVHADAMMDRIVHNAVWFDTGDKNIREYEAKLK